MFDLPSACAAGCNDRSHWSADQRQALLTLDALHVAAARVSSKDDLAAALGMVDVDGETPSATDGDWIETELALAAVLAALLLRIEKEVVTPRLAPLLTRAGAVFDEMAFHQAMGEAVTASRQLVMAGAETAPVMAFAGTVPQKAPPTPRSAVTALIEQAFAQGEARVAPGILNGTQSAAGVKSALVESTLGFIADYLPTHAQDTIERAILDALATPMVDASLARPDLLPIGQIITDAFDAAGDAYARLVANATVSRTYHYALLKAGQTQGYATATLVVTLDTKTSELCTSLAGKTYNVADMVLRYEASAAAQTTDELKQVAPWFQRDRRIPLLMDVQAYLAKVGVPIPPFHGHCRTTIRLG